MNESIGDALYAARVRLAETWYLQSDLNGYQVVDAYGWESGDPDQVRRTVFVEPDGDPGLPSVRKCLRVVFAPAGFDRILEAWIADDRGGDNEMKVDGGDGWTSRSEI